MVHNTNRGRLDLHVKLYIDLPKGVVSTKYKARCLASRRHAVCLCFTSSPQVGRQAHARSKVMETMYGRILSFQSGASRHVGRKLYVHEKGQVVKGFSPRPTAWL